MTSIGTESILEVTSPEVVFYHACKRHEPVQVSGYLQRESVAQRILAGVMLVPALPVIGILIVLIRCTSKGPGVFKQQRVGLNGVSYTMYKLRTMRSDAESKTGPIWSTQGDSRTTRLGAFLRLAHLDELPQLFNVMRGQMSLVGPRPERPEFVSVLEDEVPGYCERLRVLPGITGLAQVNLPPDTGTDSVRRKVRLDVEYIRTATWQLDVQIVLCTLLKVFLIPSGLRVRLTGVDRSECLRDIQCTQPTMALTPSELAKPHHNGHHHPKADRPHKPK